MDYCKLGTLDGKLFARDRLVTGNRVTESELERAAEYRATRKRIYLKVDRDQYVKGFKVGYLDEAEPE